MITIRESYSLDPDQVWHFVGPDLALKLFAKVISRQQLQAKSNFSSVYQTNLQGTVSAMFTVVALDPVIC